MTNKLNLPEFLVELVKQEPHEIIQNRYSCTELLKSPREIYLSRNYANECEEDASDLINTLIGTAFHEYMENHVVSGVKEEKIEFNLGDDTISCKIDLVTDDEIIDYKTCTTSKIKKGDYSDDKQQGLTYVLAYYKKYGIVKRKIKFINIIKDWSKIKAYSDLNYPQSPVYVWEYNVADSDVIWIEEKLKEILKNVKSYNIINMCNNEERWYTGDTFKVYANEGDARAKYVTDNEEDANNYQLAKGGIVKYFKGDDLKCKLYCKCRKVCERLRNGGFGN